MDLALLWCVTTTLAAPADIERPTVPGAALAAESGPVAGWTNPANLAYDPDLTWGLVAQHGLGEDTSVAASAAWRGAFAGVQSVRGPDRAADWSIDLGASVPLPQRFAIGALARWRIEGAAPDFISWDAGLSWRPLSWLGVAGITRNIGAPDPRKEDLPLAGAGLAVRPFGRTLTVGVDWLHHFDNGGTNEFVGTMRLRPTQGLYVRAFASSRGQLGGALEVYFGGQGAGAGASASLDGASTLINGWVGNDEPGESLAHRTRRVGVIRLDARPTEAPESRLLEDDRPSWLQILNDLTAAADHRAGEGLAITLDDPNLGWARAAELRGVIASTRAAGGKVTVILEGTPGNVEYYLATSADHVVMNPASTLELVGPRLVQTHYKRGLDLLGVEAEVLRRSEYKGAGEPLVSDAPSDPNRAQLEALVDDTNTTLVEALRHGRRMEGPAAQAAIDGGPYTAQEALAAGLVDALAWADEVPDALAEVHGHEVDAVRFDKRPRPHSGWARPRQVAIIPIIGVIDHGNSGGGLIGGERAGARTIVQQLAAARGDDRIDAVVLRVDSPGGSALGSEEIWRAIVKLREAGKPVVVSMADLAASGGYYVSAPANRIFAQATTITGSIGVLNTHVTFGPLLEKLGVSTHEVSRGAHAGIANSLRPWTESERARMEAMMDATYARFKAAVGAGRTLDDATVEGVARGRVWSGRRASTVGLVDAEGGLLEAVASARELAGIPPNADVDYVWYRDRRPLLAELLDGVPLPGLVTRALAEVPTEADREDTIRAELPGTLEIH
jgi:protease-4